MNDVQLLAEAYDDILRDYVLEKTEGLGNLYHATDLSKLSKIMSDNAIRLTFASAVGSEILEDEKNPFFLSTSRQKFGRYASGGDFKTKYFTNVTIDIDIDKLKRYGVKFKDWDYWGDEYKSLPSFKEEQEIRIMYNKDTLEPLYKFVDSIHVYVGGDNKEYIRYHMEYINSLKDKVNVPVYFYDNANAFKMQRTEYAITDINEFLRDFPELEPEDSERFNVNKKNKERDRGDFLIKTLLKIYNGTYDKDNPDVGPDKYTNEDRIFKYLVSFDGMSSIMSDFHNAFRHHPPAFKQWASEMRKAGVKNTKDFVKLIQDVAYETYDVYGNKKDITNE